MREITVNYIISDEEAERLKKITETYQKSMPITEEQVFRAIMLAGCKYDIEKKFEFEEFKLGLRDF